MYIVLHHTGYGEAHVDLLLETDGERLMTWRSPVWPLEPGTPLTPLPPHRRIYLTYEGPISGDRGEVRRVAEGAYRVVSTESAPVVAFEGDEETAWRLGPTAEPIGVS